MLDTEDAKTGHQKERIAGQTNQSRNRDARRWSEAVDTMLHPVAGDVSVEQRVAVNAGGMGNEPQAQHKAS